MTDTNPRRDTLPVYYLAAGFQIGAVTVGSIWLLTSEFSDNVVRNVTIDYMYEFDSSGASGNKDQAVASVEFRPGYLLVTETGGRTSLFTLDRMRHFFYKPTDPS